LTQKIKHKILFYFERFLCLITWLFAWGGK